MSINGSETTVGVDDSETQTEGEKKTRGTVTRNPRITAIARISNQLDELDEPSRRRVVRFLIEEYGQYAK